MDTVNAIEPAHRELAATLAQSGVKYALAAWIDIHGRPKSKVVPIDHLPNMLAGSERFPPRGISGLGPMDPQEAESVAMPDLAGVVWYDVDDPTGDFRLRGAPVTNAFKSLLQEACR